MSLIIISNYLKGDSKGLCSPLLTPCEKTVRTRLREDIEVEADQILIEKQNSDKSILTGNRYSRFKNHLR